jgi:DNA-binding MurR/RpiR family transcriptional regulator
MGKRLEGESITQIADSVSVAPSTVFRTLKRLEPELIEELRASGLGLDEETRSFSRV